MIALNLGCNMFKLPSFTNIDIDPNNKPDLILDATKLETKYEHNSVDFIHAGHFFEHLSSTDGQELFKSCYRILKPFGSFIVTIPDYTKCSEESIEKTEYIIMANGDHKAIYDIKRLEKFAFDAGFRIFMELDLTRNPYLLVPDKRNPVPEKWQTSFMAIKHII